MDKAEKAKITGKLTVVSAKLDAVTPMLSAVSPILPSSAAPGAPIQTAMLKDPLIKALKMQSDATKELIKLVKEVVDKS